VALIYLSTIMEASVPKEFLVSDLEFIAFSDDGNFIILQNSAGEWIEVSIKKDAPTKVTQIQPQVIENLSAREIQFRIRAGANPQDLATQTGTDLARIMIFAPPVLQERAYVAHKASNTIIRKASGTGPLLDVVLARLSPLSVDADKLEWDAFRREDSRWNITLDYPSKDGARKATWLYDARNSALVPSDEEARWLMGESTMKSPASTPTQPTEFIRMDQTPRLKVVPTEPEVDEAEVNDVDVSESEVSELDDLANANADENQIEHPTNPHLGDEMAQDSEDIGLVNKPTPKPGATLFDTLTEGEDEADGVQRPKLPSWDEILFGSRKKD
jgi:hypothetical protein